MTRTARSTRPRLLAAVGALLTLATAAPAQADPRVGGAIGVHHEVHGEIRSAYAWSGREAGVLGLPLTDEVVTPDGAGAYNVFEGGSIYWNRFRPDAAHLVRGAIRDVWGTRGWELGRIGYPVSSEYDIPGGKRQDFQDGFVEWSPATGARINQTLTTPDFPGCPFGPQQASAERAGRCFGEAWLAGRRDVMREYGSQWAVQGMLTVPRRGSLSGVACGPNPRRPPVSHSTISCTLTFSVAGAVPYAVDLDHDVVGIMRNNEVVRVHPRG
ncbi:LGFP repeat-containing protein [Kineococcus xinjiangensis]|uniref:LGFP repeat-containing protein n=1 Tax=Kineococcus xinjiangensis TaxID=512762 RepID=A0A2S6IPZ1_9ACTN|nr:hypothetical protein [Kineococcus xinjiangensis]PPK96166.1 LGFP repeat-containing protein [Kineococcus xinjiangensis]